MSRPDVRWTKGRRSTIRPARRSTRGFTLVELMVVVVIIGIIAATTVISVSIVGRDAPLERESERAFALIRYAREKAELQTRELGLFVRDREYEFLTFDPRRGIWRSIDEDDSLRLRKLPDGLQMRLVIEGREVVLTSPDTREKTEAQLEEEARTRVPHIMIFSNGDLTPFELTLERDDPVRTVTIASTEEGQVEARELVEGRS